jgi:peptide/nickel transport system permease protein
VSLGFLAALRGGLVDMVMSRLNDALLSIPHIMMGLVVIAALGSSIPVLIITSGAVYASAVFRIARALAMDLKVMDYVEVARARGEGTAWILAYEILPNAVLPLLTDFAIRLSFIILFMSGLSFLGLGVQPPAADWGSMVRENMEGLRSGSLAPIIPAAAIASVTVALNLLVDELSLRSSRVAEEARE